LDSSSMFMPKCHQLRWRKLQEISLHHCPAAMAGAYCKQRKFVTIYMSIKASPCKRLKSMRKQDSHAAGMNVQLCNVEM
jgi:hypothetical protein